jgi:hypothetical protein
MLYNDVVDVKLHSHMKYKITDAFMLSGGLPVYCILLSGEAENIIVIINHYYYYYHYLPSCSINGM